MKTATGWIKPDEIRYWKKIDSQPQIDGDIILMEGENDWLIIRIRYSEITVTSNFESESEAKFYYKYLLANHRQALDG